MTELFIKIVKCTHTLFFVQYSHCCTKECFRYGVGSPVRAVTVTPAPVVFQGFECHGVVATVKFVSFNGSSVTSGAPPTVMRAEIIAVHFSPVLFCDEGRVP